MEKDLRYEFWKLNTLGKCDTDRVAKWLDGMFTYKQVVNGDIKRGDGDIVIIGADSNELVSLDEYLRHVFPLDRVETKGIYTNMYFSREYFGLVIEDIIKRA